MNAACQRCNRAIRPSRSNLEPHEIGYCYRCRYLAFSRQERAISRDTRIEAQTADAARDLALNPPLQSPAVRGERIAHRGEVYSLAYLVTDRALYFTHASIGREEKVTVHQVRL